ncbi:MAG TPA: polysaccharide pyruvyl transferase family protein, partial [Thermoanaerobaculia bacterium]
MSQRVWKVGIAGTFDVQNYGDLLFPLIAEAELRRRLGAVQVQAFSYHERRAPEWPYDVTSVAALPDTQLDAMLIGGGFLIRFDKDVAPDYLPPHDAIHHPAGYWLTPALVALQRGIPVAWNAPGMHRNEVPQWAMPLVRLALTNSSYVAVRDEPSRTALARFAKEIHVVPDTAFGIARLLPPQPSAKLEELWKSANIRKPYVVVQAAQSSEWFNDYPRSFADLQFVALPIGPVLEDRASYLPSLASLPHWPDPLLLAEFISHAEAAIGHSYHLMITALTSGVPVFTWADLTAGKYTALRGFESIHSQSEMRASDGQWFLSRIGKRAPAPIPPELDAHWDRIADVVHAGARPSTSPAIGAFWQTLPSLLERNETRGMIDIDRIRESPLQSDPFRWAGIDRLFAPDDAAQLAETFPNDHYKLVQGYGGEKDYEYEARALIGMGADTIAHESHLSDAWKRLAADFLSTEYRDALSSLTGVDLSAALLEVNVFHYGPGASLGAHSDLPDKLVTHVLYFNDA